MQLILALISVNSGRARRSMTSCPNAQSGFASGERAVLVSCNCG